MDIEVVFVFPGDTQGGDVHVCAQTERCVGDGGVAIVLLVGRQVVG